MNEFLNTCSVDFCCWVSLSILTVIHHTVSQTQTCGTTWQLVAWTSHKCHTFPEDGERYQLLTLSMPSTSVQHLGLLRDTSCPTSPHSPATTVLLPSICPESYDREHYIALSYISASEISVKFGISNNGTYRFFVIHPRTLHSLCTEEVSSGLLQNLSFMVRLVHTSTSV